MDINQILVQLRSERERLDRAISALNGTVARRGRPASSNIVSARKRRGGRRRMSAAGRESIRRAMRKRWAAAKKDGKSRL